jgi:3-isopropylmalate dehydrogenase
VDRALASGKRTGDIMSEGCELVGTDGMTRAVLDALDELAR